MRIFNAFQTENTNQTRQTRKKAAPKNEGGPIIRDERIIQHAPPSVDESEVRDKLARAKQKNIVMTAPKKVDNFIPAHPESLDAQKAPAATEVAPKATQAAPKTAEEANQDILLKSDIVKNNPKDPRVQEKLKDALQNGAFKFNDKEREVLSKILGN